MKSSYNNNISYGDIFSTICLLKNPQKIVEIGILEGFSLKKFANNSSKNCIIEAYDIFDEFNGNSANKKFLLNNFKEYKNVNIQYGDFYSLNNKFEDKSIDILHIDIANNGNTYEYVFENYIKKIKEDGIIILEGGSIERDKISWMIKYNKKMIHPILNKYRENYNILTIGKIPSITIIQLM